MGTFDLMVYGLAKVMKKSCPLCKFSISIKLSTVKCEENSFFYSSITINNLFNFNFLNNF